MKESIIKETKNTYTQIRANLENSEAEMAILGLFQGNIVLLGCVSAIINFGILCSLWIFTVNFPLTKTPGCSFVRTKCVINTVWKSDILSNDAGH